MGRSVPQFSGLGNTNREASAPLQAAPQNGESLIRTSTHLLGMKLGYHRAEHMSRLAARLLGRYNK